MDLFGEWRETFRVLAESPSPVTVLALVVLVALVAMVGRVVKRAGYSAWWALLVLFPLVNLVALWVFAYMRWPAIDGPNRPS